MCRTVLRSRCCGGSAVGANLKMVLRYANPRAGTLAPYAGNSGIDSAQDAAIDLAKNRTRGVRIAGNNVDGISLTDDWGG
jgi:hypothetical protein